jgi:hypothetical protein
LSDRDPHWAIKKTHEIDGNSPHQHIDPERFRTHQSAKLLLHSPKERENYLAQLDSLIGDDSATLKSRAELLQLRSEMRRTHEQLLLLRR